MNILPELKSRFRVVLSELVDDPTELLGMIRPAQDAKFGDYQANVAMPLGKTLGKPPREIATEIVSKLDVSDICEPPEIAGPGFINLRLKDDWLVFRLNHAVGDQRLGVAADNEPRTYVLDYSSPNVAKPMHVGHIRSTVIGDSLSRTLRFLGHQVISDNHLGDWGTQFGMIIYGFKHFVDRNAYETAPVPELSRLYKLVNQLVEYHNAKAKLPTLESELAARTEAVATQRSQPATGDKAADKKAKKELGKLEAKVTEAAETLAATRAKLAAVEKDSKLSELADQHPNIASDVLEETAKLHRGDEENRRLWDEFLPKCREEIQKLYDRIDVKFDFEYGESFYHDRLAGVVEEFEKHGLARESEGAICVFMDGFDAPMIIRKKDGAFLYATTDLATIQFRIQQWKPDAILYVVDHRQGEHFEKFFAAAKLCGYPDVELCHVSFGTVLGDDGKPFKTRSGDTVGLEALLDEAVQRAYSVVSQNDDTKPNGPELGEAERRRVADAVGLGAIKYADLSHNRTSDYVFSYDKMLALTGNTATYLQYSYARVNGIFSKGSIDIAKLRADGTSIQIVEPAERALALELLRFSDALADVVEDYRPNQLTNYLFQLTKVFFSFYEQCPVLKAEADQTRNSRLLLCDLTARTIRQGLNLLGINVIDRM
ncbi:MAG: arginine--tRNA ligase [Planctomycetaceae bacterium]|nr:arginine--tRNA ligase [Planctomycetales bacterium]MCB9873403.1 arginine--tRNA ligase [Planctomycetaceae bacterium]MCB9939090.1 arginine--tRNA ligase [Planctomycetaceae bacterium]HRX77476.1 arginine--tRNA ligase [Pirellulaceae bacterium]